jgi:thiamine pyrophosphate-dependent acetolactate synthase large subunit-like protein
MGTSGLRQRGPQEVDIVSMFKPITKYAATVMAPSEIRIHLEKAVHLARTGRGGPVWLDVPLDVQAAPIDPSGLVGHTPEEPTRSDDIDAQALAVIDRSTWRSAQSFWAVSACDLRAQATCSGGSMRRSTSPLQRRARALA